MNGKGGPVPFTHWLSAAARIVKAMLMGFTQSWNVLVRTLSVHVLTCEFKALAYEIECTQRAKDAEKVIDPELGKGHSNLSPHLGFSQNLGPRTLICTWSTTMLQPIWGCFRRIWLGATEIEDQSTTGSQNCTPKWVYLSLMGFRKWYVQTY